MASRLSNRAIRLLTAHRNGDDGPADDPLPLVHDQSRAHATRCLHGKSRGDTLQPARARPLEDLSHGIAAR